MFVDEYDDSFVEVSGKWRLSPDWWWVSRDTITSRREEPSTDQIVSLEKDDIRLNWEGAIIKILKLPVELSETQSIASFLLPGALEHIPGQCSCHPRS